MRAASGEIAALADELQEVAERMFVGDERFTDITIWDDGDYQITIQHTFDLPDAGVGERHREVVVYHDSKHSEPMYRIEHNWYKCVDEESGEYTGCTNVLREVPV